MVVVHAPRVALAILRGRAQRARSSGDEGWGFFKPHVYSARAGVFFDIDGMGHMNNAAYLVHCELARWCGARAPAPLAPVRHLVKR